MNTSPDTATIAMIACSMGIGYHEIFNLQQPSRKERVMKKLRHLRMQELFHPFALIKASRRRSQAQREKREALGRLRVVSQGITSSELRSVIPDAKLYQSWEELLPVLDRFKDAPVKVVVYRCAPLLIPAT